MSGTPPDRRPSLSGALGRAAASALLGLAGRFTVLVSLGSMSSQVALPGLGVRLDGGAPAALLAALVHLVLLTALARAGTAPRLAVAALLAGLTTAGVGGPARLAPGLAVPVTWLVIGVAASLAALASVRTPRPVPAILALLLLGAGWSWTARANAIEVEVRRPVRELLTEVDELETVSVHPEFPPLADQICPSVEFKVEGMDMPSLVLPPPADVAFTVRPEDGDVVLRARAGVDISVLRWLLPPLDRVDFDFEVRVDDEPVFAETVTLSADDPTGSAWIRVGGDAGVPLRPGNRVVLSTRVRRPDGEPETPPVALYAGFCELLLERTTTVPARLATAERPNVLLVVIDTLRADRLSTYGYGRPTSPNLDRLARRGLVFDEAHATSSWTWPSTASILTGLQPQQHGVIGATSCYLANELDSLPEVFAEAGYRTAGWSGNPLISPRRGYGQGFGTLVVEESGFRKSAEFLDEPLAWLDENGGERFFLYLHLADPHDPYVPSETARGELAADVPESFPILLFRDYDAALRDGDGHTDAGERDTDSVVPAEHQLYLDRLYDACVRTADEALGRVLDRLDALGLTDTTRVVVTADHGEELLDRGLLAHGHSLHRELVRIPLVVAGPGLPTGRIATPVSNRFLAPTLAAHAGLELAPDVAWLDLFAERIAEEPVLFSTQNGWWNGESVVSVIGVRSGERLLQYAAKGRTWGGGEEGSDTLRLFDLGEDPDASTDLSGAYADEAQRLLSGLLQRIEALEAERRVESVAAGALTVDLLRRLGYVGDDE